MEKISVDGSRPHGPLAFGLRGPLGGGSEGDGKQLTIVLRGQRFTFNLEAFVDGATAATVGAIVSGTEDARAVVE